MWDLALYYVGWVCVVYFGFISTRKIVGDIINGFILKSLGLDFNNYVYIPYEDGKETKNIKVRYPKTTMEWLVVASFISAIGGALYLVSRSACKRTKLEAKKKVVLVYKRYTKLALFTALFPFAHANDAKEIVSFCKHVADYYRTVTSVTELLSDVSCVADDVFNLIWSDDEADLPTPQPSQQGSHYDERSKFKSIYRCEEGCKLMKDLDPNVYFGTKCVGPITDGVCTVHVCIDGKLMERGQVKGCIHASNCPAHGETSAFRSCNMFCGGHHCVHFIDCDPERNHHDEKESKHSSEKKLQGSRSSAPTFHDDIDELNIDRTHSPQDIELEDVYADTDYKDDDEVLVESDYSTDEEGDVRYMTTFTDNYDFYVNGETHVVIDGVVDPYSSPSVPSPKHERKPSLTQRVKNFLFRKNESARKFNEVMAEQRDAIRRMKSSNPRAGIGYRSWADKLCDIKNSIIFWCCAYNPWYFIVSVSKRVGQVIRNGCIRYKWWLLGGSALIISSITLYGVFRYLNKKPPTSDDEREVEGGKKRNKDGKKARFDMKEARRNISTAKAATHNPSKFSDADIDIDWRQRQADKEREREEVDRELLDREELMADYDYSPEGFLADRSLVEIKNMTRDQLLTKIKQVRETWFDKDETDGPMKIKQRRELLKNLFATLNEKYPKEGMKKRVWQKVADEPAPPAGVKPEQLRPGHMPSFVPLVYSVVAEYEHGDDGYVNCFAYNNCVFVPRHGVSGAKKVSIVVGARKIELPAKCVLMKDGTDEVMYPLPAGVLQNKGLKFRMPNKGEIATLFYVPPKQFRVVQSTGVVGPQNHLGKDKSLMTFKFDASTVDGACGGIYISAVDGYCIGVHGLGGVHVSTMPEFYPFRAAWIEELTSAAKRTPTYIALEDKKYYDTMDAIVNNEKSISSLNL